MSRCSSVVEWCTISPDGRLSPAVTISSCSGQRRQTPQSTSAQPAGKRRPFAARQQRGVSGIDGIALKVTNGVDAAVDADQLAGARPTRRSSWVDMPRLEQSART